LEEKEEGINWMKKIVKGMKENKIKGTLENKFRK